MKAAMNSIQSLDNRLIKEQLSNMDKWAITRANNQIIIEPVKREIVYVPYYDPRVVYGAHGAGVWLIHRYWEFGLCWLSLSSEP